MCKQQQSRDGADHQQPDRMRRGLVAAATVGLAIKPLVGCAARRGDAELAEKYWLPVPTPDAALARLYEGNKRFVAGEILAPNRNLSHVKTVAAGQKPFAAFLSCADSRVPVEIIFDQGFGDVFVTRVAGNVVTPELTGSLEFGCQVLGAKVLYVLGHTACGAVAATATAGEVPGLIGTLYYHIKPAIRAAQGNVERAIVENVRVQCRQLAEASPVISRLIRDGALKVAGGVYDLQSGVVTPVAF